MNKLAFLEFPINPLAIPSVREREDLIDAYAQQFIDSRDGFDTVSDFCKQIALDTGDKTITVELAARIRQFKGRMRRLAA